MAALDGLFDRYDLVARLFPGLLALAPVFWSLAAFYPTLLNSPPESAALAIFAASALYFLTAMVRSTGARTEKALVDEWGGWPTTSLLRFSDHALDPVTKARYHQTLSTLSGVSLPKDLAAEKQDTGHADMLYRSATMKLLELRRGPDFNLIALENAAYGFSRNMFALKQAGIRVAGVMAALTAAAWALMIWRHPGASLVSSVTHYPHLPVLLVLDLGYLALWRRAIHKDFVLHAAKDYAFALLRSLDK